MIPHLKGFSMNQYVLALRFVLFLLGSSQAQASCLILGDSIAQGLSRELTKCDHITKVGAPTSWISSHAPKASYDKVFISAGSNDWYLQRGLYRRLDVLRSRIWATNITWILPNLDGPRQDVASVAQSHGDKYVSFLAGPDHIHPKSYQALSKSVLTQ